MNLWILMFYVMQKRSKQKQGSLRLNLCHNVLKFKKRLLPLKKKLSRKCNSNSWKQIKKLGLCIIALLMCGHFLLRIIISEKVMVGLSQTLRCVIYHPTEQCHSSSSISNGTCHLQSTAWNHIHEKSH